MSASSNAAESGDKPPVMKFLKLLGQILIWLADGKRDMEHMLRLLQLVNDRSDFVFVLDRPVQASVNTDEPADGWAAEWTRFYHEIFGITVDLSGVRIPDDPGGFGRVVFVASGLTLNTVWGKCRKWFPSSSVYGDDMDTAVPANSTEEPYAKRFRNRVEADEENKSLSADTLCQRNANSITLLTRLLLELWYCWRTGGAHLDLINWTLCAGSRDGDGGVPCVYWGGRELRVCYYSPDDARDDIRARSAV